MLASIPRPIASDVAQKPWSSVRHEAQIRRRTALNGPLRPHDLRCSHSRSSAPHHSRMIVGRCYTGSYRWAGEPDGIRWRSRL